MIYHDNASSIYALELTHQHCNLAIRICCIVRFYNPVHIAGLKSSAIYTDVLDMCSEIYQTSTAFYLTSPAFPTGFRGTGMCMCTMKPVKRKCVKASIQVEHIMLSDPGECNEAFDIFSYKIGNKDEKVISECSPSQFTSSIFSVMAKEMRVSFQRKIITNTSEKTMVWIGIRGMFREIVLISWRRHTM